MEGDEVLKCCVAVTGREVGFPSTAEVIMLPGLANR